MVCAMIQIKVNIFLIPVLAYLIGAVPAAAWIARLYGIDIRKVGSGNSGATNVLRSIGILPALVVASFDIGKGALAVYLAHLFGLDSPQAALCGVLAVVGHNFSPFLQFRGGKGVATSFGVIATISPIIGFSAFVLAIFCMWLTRFVSAGSIMGAATVLVLCAITQPPMWLTSALCFLGLLLIWQHRDNIQRLTSGTEKRLGQKSE